MKRRLFIKSIIIFMVYGFFGWVLHHIIQIGSGGKESEGLAMKMLEKDHRKLTSTGSSNEARAFRDEVKRLLDAGKLVV